MLNPPFILAVILIAALGPSWIRCETISVVSQPEFQQALLNSKYDEILVQKPLEINSSTWQHVVVSRTVLIRSTYRVIIDWCDEACNSGTSNRTEPFITVARNGDITFNRLFFRNFLPTQSGTLLPAYADIESPVPGIVCKDGGRVTFRLVVWHFMQENMYAFNASTSPHKYWVTASINVMKTPSYDMSFTPSEPALYYIKNHQTPATAGGLYIVVDSYSPVDVLGCFGDVPVSQGTTLVYCPYTTKDALSSPHVSTIVVHHDVGLDTLFYSYWDPVNITRAVSIRPCPGPPRTIDSDFVHSSVVIKQGGSVTYESLNFAVSAAGYRPLWPSYNPLLLSIYDVRENGKLTFRNSAFTVSNLTWVKSQLDKLPKQTSQPQLPDLSPAYVGTPAPDATNFTIRTWDLTKAQWLLYTQGSYASGNEDSSAWTFENVTVRQGSLHCFHGPINQGTIRPDQVVQVVDEATLYSALNNNTGARYVQLMADVTLTPAFWSQKPLQTVQSLVEIRACHPEYNRRYVLDFGDLSDIIRVTSGRMAIEGDISIRGLGWQSMSSMTRLINAIHVSPAAVLEVQYVELTGVLPQGASGESFVQNGLQIQASATSGQVLSTDASHIEFGLYYVRQPATAGSSSAVPSGQWSLVNTKVYWRESPGGGGASVPLAAVVAPVVVGCALLALAAAALVVYARRRQRQRQQQVQDGKYASTSSDAPTSFGSEHLSKSLFAGMKLPAGSGTANSTSGFQSDSARQRLGPGQDIEAACRTMVGARVGAQGGQETVVLEGLLGEGSYGKVFRATWKGTVVAVKIMVLPSYMSGKEKREKMAIMETAISSLLSHPNIVQTYTYSVEPVMGNANSATGTSSGIAISLHDSTVSVQDSTSEVHSWEVRLVQEFCDLGSLRDVLNARKGLKTGDGSGVDMLAVLDTVLDIARAMAHLHTENIVHSDLKARNVLLKSAATDARGFIAKVADFGLSLKMDANDTHISNAYQGTLTHMAPETLMRGHLSKASDVYAFGILLWEVYTGGHAFKGTPKALLGHSITKDGLRPQFDSECPFEYQFLACRCWESDPSIRPTFEQVLEELKRIKRRLTGARDDGSETSYQYMRMHSSGSAGHGGREWSLSDASLEHAAGGRSSAEAGTGVARVPAHQLQMQQRALVAGLASETTKSMYVDSSSIMEGMQQGGHGEEQRTCDDISLYLPEGDGSEQGRSSQLHCDPQHLV